MRLIEADGESKTKFLEELKRREAETEKAITDIVTKIIDDVKNRGDEAIKQYGIAFDGICPLAFEVPKRELKAAYDAADVNFRVALEQAAENIREYHEKQLESGYSIERPHGSFLGQRIVAMNRVGIYVPGGKAAYPSTVLMNAIPAKIAGVNELIMTTPPKIIKVGESTTAAANQDILAAAYIGGIDRVFLAGGAQALAALAFGTESFPKVDKLVGPGNVYVATAKRLLYGKVDIDMIAGPSEILIIADHTANPCYVAADLLSQAEHDTMAASILLTTSRELAEAVCLEIEKQAEILDKKDIIKRSLTDYGAIILCRNRGEMTALSNAIAPEHLEIMAEKPMELFESIQNAGSVFIGEFSPEPLGDYYAGTNHVLPTSGTARFSSPLGVYSFVKRMSYTHYAKETLKEAMPDILEIAKKEGLTAHANAIKIRFSEDGDA